MTVLEVLGHIGAILAHIVVILIICFIVLPIVYRVHVEKPEEGDFSFSGFIRWLFGFVWISFWYDKDGFGWRARVVGIPLSDLLQKRRDRVNKKLDVVEGAVRAKKQPTIKPGQRSFKVDETADDVEVFDIDEEQRKYFTDERVFAEEPKQSIFEKIRLTIQGIYDRIISLKGILDILKLVWPYLVKLIKHILPKHIEGEVLFGLDDPSATGKILGLIGLFYPVIPEKLEVIPDFQEERFSCDLKARGHFFAIYLIVYFVKIIRVPGVGSILKRYMSRRRKNV